MPQKQRIMQAPLIASPSVKAEIDKIEEEGQTYLKMLQEGIREKNLKITVNRTANSFY
jgi:hypothetical protein